MTDAELQDLLRLSSEANSRFNVTGMLIYLTENFIQLIEGSKADIEQLYLNIKQDKRHFRVTTLREGPIDQRFFPDWAMAFKKQDAGNTDGAILGLQDKKVIQLFDILENWYNRVVII